MWLRERACGEKIEKVWSSQSKGRSTSGISNMLSRCAIELRVWGMETFGSWKKELKEWCGKVSRLRKLFPQESIAKKIMEAEKHIHRILANQEI